MGDIGTCGNKLIGMLRSAKSFEGNKVLLMVLEGILEHDIETELLQFVRQARGISFCPRDGEVHDIVVMGQEIDA